MALGWKDILKQIAPALGTVLGGPAAGAALKVLSEVLLGKKEGTEAEIEKAFVGADAETLLKVKEADQKFALEMEKVGLDLAKLTHEEKKSARDLFRYNIWPQITLSAVYVSGYFGVLIMLLTGKFTPSADVADMVKTLVAGLGAVVFMIMQFWFGTSFGSARKTEALYASNPIINGNGGNGK